MGLFGKTKAKKPPTGLHVPGVYVGSEVPGKTIDKSFGLIHHAAIVNNPYEIVMNAQNELEILLNTAKEQGGDCVINARLEVAVASDANNITKSYIFIAAYGEAVVTI